METTRTATTERNRAVRRETAAAAPRGAPARRAYEPLVPRSTGTPAAPPPRRSWAGRVPDWTEVLRWAGAAVIVAAAAAFIVQHWGAAGDIGNAFQFLGFTIVLGAAGLLTGLRMNDPRGARVFFGLAAMTVPAHFAYLGGLVYSLFPASRGFRYPGYAHVTAADPLQVAAAIGVALLVLAPVILAAFRVLVRDCAGELTALYIGLSAALLIPTREPHLVALIAFALAVMTAAFDAFLHRWALMRTWEGAAVRAMLAAPCVVVLGRSFALYSPTGLLLGTSLAVAAIVLFELLPRYVPSRSAAAALQILGAVCAVAAWPLSAADLLAPFSDGGRWTLPVMTLPLGILLSAMSFRALAFGRVYRGIGGFVASAGMLTTLVLHPGLDVSTICLVTGMASLIHGYASRSRVPFAFGIAAAAAAVGYDVRTAFVHYGVGPWASLGVIGTAAVLAAAAGEKHRAFIREHLAWLRPGREEETILPARTGMASGS